MLVQKPLLFLPHGKLRVTRSQLFAPVPVFLGDETKLARPAAYDFEFRKIIFSYFFIVTAIQEEVLPPLSFLSLFLGLVDLISHCFWISSISCLHSSPPFLFFLNSHFSHSTPTLPPSLFSLSLSLLFCFGRPPFLSNLSNSIGWGGEVRVDPPT